MKLTDNIAECLNIEEVTEEVKHTFTLWLLNDLLPVAKVSAKDFIAQITEQSKAEKGWTKVRDLIVLPAIINGVLWLCETSLKKCSNK